MLRVCVVLCRCFYCYCIIVQTAQDRQGTAHARVCYCYRLVLDNTETHWYVHWVPTCVIWGRIGVPKRAQKEGAKKRKSACALSTTAIILRMQRRPQHDHRKGWQRKSTCFVGALAIFDFAGKVDYHQTQVRVQTQHGDTRGILCASGSCTCP